MPDTIIFILISTFLLSIIITYFIILCHEPYDFGRIRKLCLDATYIKPKENPNATISIIPDNQYIKALKKAQAQFNAIKRAYEDEKDFGEDQNIPTLINQGIEDIRNVLIKSNHKNKGETYNV